MLKEFQEFINRGNVIDLAVAVIIGGAFGAIISSFIDDIVMPLIGVLLGGIEFTSLSITVGESAILYGNFIQAVINFLVIALAMFFVVRGYNSLRKGQEEVEKSEPPQPTVEEQLLTEIRDILKASN